MREIVTCEDRRCGRPLCTRFCYEPKTVLKSDLLKDREKELNIVQVCRGICIWFSKNFSEKADFQSSRHAKEKQYMISKLMLKEENGTI